MSPNTLRDVIGGVTCGIISIFFGLSFAAVIFSGPLNPWLGQGIAITVLATVIAGALFSSASSLKFAIAGPDSSTTAVMAAFAAAFAEGLLRSGVAQADLLAPTLFAMALCSGLTGLALYGLGFARAGRAIRFVPYPVIGGFLGATGWLMTSGALRVIADIRFDKLSLHNLDGNADKLAAAAVVALAILAQRRFVRNVLALPLLLTAAILAFHVLRWALGVPLADATAAGWTFAPQASLALATPPVLASAGFPWAQILPHAGDIMAVAFVTAVAMLLNTTGVELATSSEADLDRDLRVLGLTNLASAALGGYVSCVSLSRSTINYACGARGRAGGFTLAATAAAMLLLDPAALAYVPKFVLGGLLLFSGLDLAYRWLITSQQRLPLPDYLSLVLIAIIISNWGFVAGVLVGIIIGCATFALSASRVDAIKFSFDGTQHRSSLDRGVEELQILARHGQELQGMSLHSYLFFGTTNRLYQHVKALLTGATRCRFLIFDCRLVTGMDSSATQSFAQIKTVAETSGTGIVMASVTGEMEQLLRISGMLTSSIHLEPNLDRALEWCENELITSYRNAQLASADLQEWLSVALGSAELAKPLVAACRLRRVAAGETIARQGEPSDRMHFILSGRVGILIGTSGSGSVRVRSLSGLTTVGEMGLITGQARTASIEAEVDTELYELDAEAFRALSAAHPALCQALLSYIIRILGERLAFANRAIGVLRN